MKKIIAILLTTSMALSAAACSQSTPAPAPAPEPAAAAPAEAAPAAEPAAAEPAAEDKKLTIGIAMPHFDAFFFTYEKDVAAKVAEERGAEVKVVVAENDINKQLSQIEDFINSGVDGILCVPVDTTAIESAVAKSAQAGIPFATMGRNPSDMTYLSLGILCDNIDAARKCAQRIDEAAKEQGIEGPIKVIEIIGDLKDSNAVERSEGFKDECAKLGIEIVAEAPCEWNSEKAYSRLNDAIQAVGGDFNAVYCPADPFLPAVISALTKNNKFFPVGDPNHVLVVGIDGDPLAYEMIRDGSIDGTANTDAGMFGRMGMEGLIDVINGNPPADKAVYVPSIFVTKEVLESPEAQEYWGVVAEQQGQ